MLLALMFFTVDLYSEWDVLYCETRAPIIFFPGNHSHSMISLAVTGRAPLPGIIKMFCSCYWKSWEMQNRRTWRGEKGVRKSIEEVAGKWSSRQSELSTWSGEEKDGPQAVSVWVKGTRHSHPCTHFFGSVYRRKAWWKICKQK